MSPHTCNPCLRSVHRWVGDTEWHHFAVVVPEGDLVKSNMLLLYFDGQLKKGDTFDRPVTILNTAPGPLKIGMMSGWDGFHFNGIIDEVAIFPRDLGPENIAAMATSPLEIAQSVSPSGKLTTAWGFLKTQ